MTKIEVTGMSCGHCQNAVKSALEEVPGVTAVEVDLASGLATVEGDADPQALVAAVEAEGYQASPTA